MWLALCLSARLLSGKNAGQEGGNGVACKKLIRIFAMKVCIVTVYDSINSGSFWQAYTLGQALRNMGHTVCYLEREKSGGASSSKMAQAKKVVKFLLKGHATHAVDYIKTIRGFQEAHKKFSIVQNNENSFDDIDCFVLGSDTIWNLDSKYFQHNYKIFWGEAFSNKKVVTYAASVANTSLEKCTQLENIEQIVSQWSAVGVRDLQTKNIINHFTDRSVEIVCDPTLLLTKAEYQKWAQRLHPTSYVFLYLFNELTPTQIDALVAFCRENNLSIINGVTNYNKAFFDVQAINTPDAFLSYMYFADYVITDTFHGTVFSVNLQKDFVVIDRGQNKVIDFLNRVGFKDRVVKNPDSLTPVLNRPIDYSEKEDAVNEWREKSIRFLKSAVEETDCDS